MTREQEIAERWKKATPGPWALEWDFEGESRWPWRIKGVANFPEEEARIPDAEAIAHAPDDIAYLLAEVERLRKRLNEAMAERDDWRQRHADMQADRDRVGLERNRYKAVVEAAREVWIPDSVDDGSLFANLRDALRALDQPVREEGEEE